MSSTFNQVVEDARKAWLSNYTIADARWRLRQLHGLHQLVLKNRETLINALAEEQGVSAILYEKEVAIFVQELQSHISRINKNAPTKLLRSSLWGDVVLEERPRGISLIISNSSNLIRFALAPLAASIMANNIVILATPASTESSFVSCIKREWNRYLSPETLFFLPGIGAADITAGKVDHIAILDSSPNDYATILQSPEAYFYSTAAGYNVVIVDEGKKDWLNIAKQVCSNSTTNTLPSDRLSAVVIRTDDMAEFRQLLSDQWTRNKPVIFQKRQQLRDCISWGNSVFCLDTSSGATEVSDFSLNSCLSLAQASGALVVVPVTSLDKGVDMLNNLTTPIKQLALVAPGSKHAAQYVRKWINSTTFTIGTFGTVLSPAFDSFVSPASLESIFPATLFSRPQVITEKGVIALPKNILDIRATYERMIPPLKPEPRGERIGFFTQAEYLVKGVGAVTVGLMGIGLYFGSRAIQRRFF